MKPLEIADNLSPLSPADTGLDRNLFVALDYSDPESPDRRRPHLFIQQNSSPECNPHRTSVVWIDPETPEVAERDGLADLTDEQEERLKLWVVLNFEALTGLWNGQISAVEFAQRQRRLQATDKPTRIEKAGGRYRGCTSRPYLIFEGVTGDDVAELCIAEGAEVVAHEACLGAQGLRSVEFPSTLRYIGTQAFAHSGLKALNLPDSAAEWWQLDIPYVFEGCAFTSCSVPSALKEAGGDYFTRDGIYAWYAEMPCLVTFRHPDGSEEVYDPQPDRDERRRQAEERKEAMNQRHAEASDDEVPW